MAWLAALALTGCAWPAPRGTTPYATASAGGTLAPVPAATLPEAAVTTVNPRATDGAPAIRVYFTAPGERQVGEQAETALLAAIDGAQRSVDVAVYNFSLSSVADALAEAAARGVSVRLALNDEAMDQPVLERLSAAGLPLVSDGPGSLMHNKFLVIDGREVWTGSANLTRSSFYDDNNNLVRLESEALASLYEAEFEEMFVQKVFGGGAHTPSGKNRLEIGGTAVEVYFAPEDHPAARLEQLVENAGSEIDFLAYAFTLNDLRRAMLDATDAGVRLAGVFDEDQANATGGEYDVFRQAGVAVRLDGNPGLMHDKVIVLDGETVALGSFNFTRSADEKNDENLLVLHDPVIAAQYLAEFQRIYAEGR
jgi:phosphatidylserine/phosphatidylglycerophosphate/cardiolipin synthase-like enzyme